VKRPAEVDTFVVADMFFVHSVCAVSHVVGVTDVQQRKHAVECSPTVGVSYRHGLFFAFCLALSAAILIKRKNFIRRSATPGDIVSVDTDVSGRLWIRCATFVRCWIKV
jgi:hypothetical protein